MPIKDTNVHMQVYDLARGYTLIDGFVFSALTYPFNVHDAIVVKCPGRSDCISPRFEVPLHGLQDYIDHINRYRIEKAVILLDDISFITRCRTLKHFRIIPSNQAEGEFDYSPLYDMDAISSLNCQTRYGDHEQYCSTIDYARVHGLQDLNVDVNKATFNFNSIDTLKSLWISHCKGYRHNLSDLFGSRQLDTLIAVQCGIRSLEGIGMSNSMQCVYLYNNLALTDISKLREVSSTLKALRIVNSSRIVDFEVLRELSNLEYLEIVGNIAVKDMNFLNDMKQLKTLVFKVDVLNGDLSPCDRIDYVYLLQNRNHFNRKDHQLPKLPISQIVRGNEDIERWRRKE